MMFWHLAIYDDKDIEFDTWLCEKGNKYVGRHLVRSASALIP